MNFSKKIISGILTAALVLGLTACGETANPETSTGNNNSGTSTAGDTSTNGGAPSNGTVVKWLGYYDLAKNDTEMCDKLEDKYGLTVESQLCTSLDYFETLAKLIAAGDSPDLVRYEWQSFPHGMSKNLYTAVDDYIDLDSANWSGMKETAENFVWNGKHYYVPYRINPGFVLFYDRTQLEDAGITDDPWDMYENDEWTWDAWKSIMQDWCDAADGNYGYKMGVTGMSIIVTTGTKLIDVQSENKAIVNNMKDANVQRAQEFMESLYKQNLIDGVYTGPGDAFKAGNVLFTGFGLDWGYDEIAKAMAGDEVMFVPFPRDEKADAYYVNSDTFGYMIPANAQNIDGAVKWIELNRANEIDEENIASAKELATAEHLYYPKCTECKETSDKISATCPNCGADKRENTNRAAYTEELYDLKMELSNPTSTKFKFIFDDCFGFNTDLTSVINGKDDAEDGIVSGSFIHGTSYTTIRDSLFGTVESYLEPYRATMS